jgi:hypothetical protein
MLNLGSDEVRGAGSRGVERPLQGEIVRLRAGCGEDQLFGARVEQRRGLLPRLGEEAPRLLPGPVETGRVAEGAELPRHHTDDVRGERCGGAVVQVDEAPLLHGSLSFPVAVRTTHYDSRSR